MGQFGDFYLDYASYMKAWSEIELAKRAHDEEKFDVAMQHYEKASQLLRQSKSWTYLSQNFSAWSHISQAEDLSRKENCKDSIEAFEKAIKSLHESKRSLSMKLEGIDKTDERDLINRLIQVSEIREEYSRGRIAVEEAKSLDKKGDHHSKLRQIRQSRVRFSKEFRLWTLDKRQRSKTSNLSVPSMAKNDSGRSAGFPDNVSRRRQNSSNLQTNIL